jgi:hypothetical protein
MSLAENGDQDFFDGPLLPCNHPAELLTGMGDELVGGVKLVG